jgi:hypothetical protein
MKVTSKTPLYRIIEAVKDQFGVCLDYYWAHIIRNAAKKKWLDWNDKVLRIVEEPGKTQFVITPIGILDGDIPYSIEDWNGDGGDFKLRQRPRWYVIKWHEGIVSGPYDTPDAAHDIMVECQEGDQHSTYMVASRSKCKRWGLLKDETV